MTDYAATGGAIVLALLTVALVLVALFAPLLAYTEGWITFEVAVLWALAWIPLFGVEVSD